MVDPTTEGAAAIAEQEGALREGARIGRYRVELLLGRGGMGAVYAAEDTMLGRRVALKVVSLPASLVGSKAEEAKARLLREARAAASLEHPNVVAIYDVGEHDGAPFFAMELVVGRTLRERMTEPSSLQEKIDWLVDIAKALQAAHDKGIVHRDVKPENVMITRDGRVKVLDFGIARQAAMPIDPSAPTETSGAPLGTLTADGALVGTPRYMAPEQLKGEKLDGRCDQFAWGVVAYELLSGKAPWEASDAVTLIASILGKNPPPLGEVAPKVPSATATVIARAMSKSPDGRFDSMADVVKALQSAAPVPQQPARPKRLKMIWPLVAGLGAIALGVRLFGGHNTDVAKPVGGVSSAPVASALVSSDDGSGVAITDLPLPQTEVPGALAAYKAGMQAFRDGDDLAAISNFEAARKLDPGMGAAYLQGGRLGGWSQTETAELFRQAAERRSTLPEHEALLLDALLPCAQQRAGADHWCVERVQALSKQHPRDAGYAFELGARLGYAGLMSASRDACRRAVDLDPKFAKARQWEIWALEYLGDFEGVTKEAAACVDKSPSVGCLRARGVVEAQLGQADKLEATAQAILGMSPNNLNGMDGLAYSAICLNRPTATLRSLLEREMPTLPTSLQPEHHLFGERSMALWSGDFASARGFNEDLERLRQNNSEMTRRSGLAWMSIVLDFETGHPDDAASAARAYLDVRGTLVGSRLEDESALAEYTTWMMLNALRRADRMSKAEVRAERDRFIAEWEPRLGPDYQPFLWLETYATLSDDADDAREALEALPRFNGLPKAFFNLPDELYIGRVYALAGRVDEAIPWLAQAAHACRGIDPRVVWANLELGKALERSDKPGACEAYAFVLKRWGNAKPKSVTADETKKRSKALGCAR